MVNLLRSKLASTRTKWGGGGILDILVSTTELIAHSRKRPEDYFSLTPRGKMYQWKMYGEK